MYLQKSTVLPTVPQVSGVATATLTTIMINMLAKQINKHAAKNKNIKCKNQK